MDKPSKSTTACSHDVETCRAGQLEDDEIAVVQEMRADGRCPLCNPNMLAAYQSKVETRRRPLFPTDDHQGGRPEDFFRHREWTNYP